MKFIALFLLLLNLFFSNVSSIVVKTDCGMVRGEYLRAIPGKLKYVSFKGIPFAKPPLGNLRFMAPQPPEPWSGVRNATKHGSRCLQLNVYTGTGITGSEDCLYLNVYTPNLKPKNPLSVMVFIHGGGYQSGSGDTERYGPDYIMPENVILVTSNHRLGALGFTNLNIKEVPGNAGMKDQVAALRWVQRNIANFGGDPNKVTIFGQSTGGASIGFHNMSPMTKGLYQRSIAMSGSPLTYFAWPFETTRLAFRLGQQLGYWTRDVKKLYKFLKSVKAESLLGKYPAVLRAEEPRISLRQLIYTPVVETDFGQERFLTMDPVRALKRGKIHNVDLMIGRVTIEAIIRFLFGESKVPQLYTNYTELLVPRLILETIPPRDMFNIADNIHAKYFGNNQIDNKMGKEFVKYVSDSSFNYGIIKYAKMFSALRNTYLYKFSKQSVFPRYEELSNEFGMVGAIHEDDLPYILRPDYVTSVDKSSDDYKVIKKTCALFANFAKYGNPTPKNQFGVNWPKYNNNTGYYMDINVNLTLGQRLDDDVVKFWDFIYKISKLQFNGEFN